MSQSCSPSPETLRRRTRQFASESSSYSSRSVEQWSVHRIKKPALTAFPQPAPANTFIRKPRRSEVDLRAQLVSARVGRYPARSPESGHRLPVRVQPGVVIVEIDVIQDVEDVECEANLRRRPSECRQVLSETHIDVLVRERTRNRKAASLEHRAEPLAASVQGVLPAQRDKS